MEKPLTKNLCVVDPRNGKYGEIGYADPEALSGLPPAALASLACQVKALTNSFKAKKSGVLPVTSESVLKSLVNRKAYAFYDNKGNLALFSRESVLWDLASLQEVKDLAQYPLPTIKVVEIGTTIKGESNLDRLRLLPYMRQIQAERVQGDDTLAICTNRDPKVVQTNLEAGFVMVNWKDFPAIQALTCDPGCNPKKDGAWSHCDSTGVHCSACNSGAQPADRNDSCSLLVSNLETARKWNDEIMQNPIFQTDGIFDARKFRDTLDLDSTAKEIQNGKAQLQN